MSLRPKKKLQIDVDDIVTKVHCFAALQLWPSACGTHYTPSPILQFLHI